MDSRHYVYAWKEPNGTPFYIGQGTKEFDRVEKYRRAYSNRHYFRNGVASYAQNKANKLAKLGTPHVVEILFDDLTQSEADNIEKELIIKYGRVCEGTGSLCNISEGGDFRPHKDPIVYERWLKAKRAKTAEIMNDPDQHEKWKNALVEANGKKITHDGIEYPSITELAKKLDISPITLSHRIRNNIDLQKPVANRRTTFEYDGKIFKSRKEMCCFLGINISTYKYRLKHGLDLMSGVKINK